MFLSTFEAWRREILLGRNLAVLADLGEGVMEQAMVEAAAYVPLLEDRVIVLAGERLRNAALHPAYGGYDLAVVGVRDAPG